MEKSILNTYNNFNYFFNNILNIFNSINSFIIQNFQFIYNNTENYLYFNIYRPINRLYCQNIYTENQIKSVLIIEKYMISYLEKKRLDKAKKAVELIQNEYFKHLNNKKYHLNQIIIPYLKRKNNMDTFNRKKVATLILQKHYNKNYIQKKLSQFTTENINNNSIKKWGFLWF